MPCRKPRHGVASAGRTEGEVQIRFSSPVEEEEEDEDCHRSPVWAVSNNDTRDRQSRCHGGDGAVSSRWSRADQQLSTAVVVMAHEVTGCAKKGNPVEDEERAM